MKRSKRGAMTLKRIPHERAVLAYWMSKRGFTMTYADKTGVYTFVNGEDENDQVAIVAEGDGYTFTRGNENTQCLDQNALRIHIEETI